MFTVILRDEKKKRVLVCEAKNPFKRKLEAEKRIGRKMEFVFIANVSRSYNTLQYLIRYYPQCYQGYKWFLETEEFHKKMTEARINKENLMNDDNFKKHLENPKAHLLTWL